MDIRDALRAGDKRAAARLITMLENHEPEGLRILASFADIPARARVIGITGAPGAGKSTLTDQLAKHQVREGRRVGIIAVDPSSPVTGGAFLGDRIRMSDLNSMPEVFIRSMATRGALGGISKAAAAAVRVLDLFGADIIFVETVGTGQSEVDVAGLADTVVLVLTPGMGDDIQAEKAGILELTDIIAVNKADLDGTDRTIRQLLSMLTPRGAQVSDGTATPGDDIRIVPTVAATGAGIDDLIKAIEAQRPPAAGASVKPFLQTPLEREAAFSAALKKLEQEFQHFAAESADLTTGPDSPFPEPAEQEDAADRILKAFYSWRSQKC